MTIRWLKQIAVVVVLVASCEVSIAQEDNLELFQQTAPIVIFTVDLQGRLLPSVTMMEVNSTDEARKILTLEPLIAELELAGDQTELYQRIAVDWNKS